MDYGAIVSDAAGYAKTALVKNPITWLIFIICGLPFALVRFVCDPKTIITGTRVHWELIPWPQIILLCLAGLVLGILLSGYLVRIYRGITPPPLFDAWGTLFLDGLKLVIVSILWFIPALVVIIAALALLLVGSASTIHGNPMISAAMIFLLIGLILLVITILYAILGSVRFARTGSMREGLRFSAITGTIQAIGWGVYILALVIMMVLVILASLVISLFALIPFAGWVIQLVLTPIISVFSARYISRVYDHSVPQAPAPAPVTA
jgi:hypothetical protein